MALSRVGSTLTAAAASRSVDLANRQVEHALRALSSGKRIVDAADDAAGFAIGESLRAQMSGLRQSRENAAQAQSFIQVAEGALNEQNNILIRLRELGVQASSDTISDTERSFVNQEFQQLTGELDRIAKTTRYGSQSLLQGAGRTFQFQVGPYNDKFNRIAYELKADTTADSLEIAELTIEDRDSARDSLEKIDHAISQIAGVRADFGAMQARLQIAQDHADVDHQNLSESHSRIVDADIAEETSLLARGKLLQQAGIAVLAQANQSVERVARLLD